MTKETKRVIVTGGANCNWYKKYQGKIFEVMKDSKYSTHVLERTPHNEKILEEKQELLNRLKTHDLGISSNHCSDFFIFTSNKDASILLKEDSE